jgi:hypothetical protein
MKRAGRRGGGGLSVMAGYVDGRTMYMYLVASLDSPGAHSVHQLQSRLQHLFITHGQRENAILCTICHTRGSFGARSLPSYGCSCGNHVGPRDVCGCFIQLTRGTRCIRSVYYIRITTRHQPIRPPAAVECANPQPWPHTPEFPYPETPITPNPTPQVHTTIPFPHTPSMK